MLHRLDVIPDDLLPTQCGRQGLLLRLETLSLSKVTDTPPFLFRLLELNSASGGSGCQPDSRKEVNAMQINVTKQVIPPSSKGKLA
jgi:hypothetical protein